MRLSTALLLTLFALIAGSCSKADKQADASPTPARAEGPAAQFAKYSIVLLPTTDFPQDLATQIAKTAAADTGLVVKTMLPLGVRDWEPYPDRVQYDPTQLETLAAPVIERLKKSYGGEVYVLLTTRDIGPADKSLNFLFCQHDYVQKITVLSTARMTYDLRGYAAAPALVQTRLRKMLLRTIGIQYYELPRSSDINDVMYSPLMSLDDLDHMGLTLKPKSAPSSPQSPPTLPPAPRATPPNTKIDA